MRHYQEWIFNLLMVGTWCFSSYPRHVCPYHIIYRNIISLRSMIYSPKYPRLSQICHLNMAKIAMVLYAREECATESTVGRYAYRNVNYEDTSCIGIPDIFTMQHWTRHLQIHNHTHTRISTFFHNVAVILRSPRSYRLAFIKRERSSCIDLTIYGRVVVSDVNRF